MRTLRILLIILILTTAAIQFAVELYLPAQASAIDSVSLIQKINQERINRNIPQLAISSKLSSAAAAKTEDMFARDYFDHVDPDGKYVWFRIEAAGYKPYRMLGENLAIDFSTEDGIVKAWINSPTHRDNMLKSEFADQGLSAQYGDYQTRYTSLVTSLFGTLAVAPAKPKTAPKSTPTVKPAATEPVPKAEIQPATAPATQAPAPTSAQTPAAETASINDPAVQLSPSPPQAQPIAENQQPFTVVIPSNLTVEDVNVFEVVRTVFIVLVILLLFTIVIDSLLTGRAKGLWNDRTLSIIVMVLMVSILTLRQY